MYTNINKVFEKYLELEEKLEQHTSELNAYKVSENFYNVTICHVLDKNGIFNNCFALKKLLNSCNITLCMATDSTFENVELINTVAETLNNIEIRLKKDSRFVNNLKTKVTSFIDRDSDRHNN